MADAHSGGWQSCVYTIGNIGKFGRNNPKKLCY